MSCYSAIDRGVLSLNDKDKSPTKFDSPSSFSVTGVVSGWTTVLQYMHTKERWILYIPYQCGYGESGYSSILGYSTLTFDMQLEAVK